MMLFPAFLIATQMANAPVFDAIHESPMYRRTPRSPSRYWQLPSLESLEPRQLLAADVALDTDVMTTEAVSNAGPSNWQPWLNAPDLPAPTGTVVQVANDAELQQAINNLRPNTTIVLASNTYQLSRTLWIREDNVTLRGATQDPNDVVLAGPGMENANYGNVPHGIWSDAANVRIQNLTIRDVYFHPIQFSPEADSPQMTNLRLIDAGEQFIKASSGGFGVGVDNGLVEYTVMEYTNGPPSTDHGGGTGYTNGVDVHGGEDWIIRKNLFKDFHTPDNAQHLWNPAILMWNGARGTISEGNTFINVDRAIAYGLTDRTGSDHSGGVIRNNFIYAEPNLFSSSRKSSSDGQIIVWDSPNTKVLHNTVLGNGNFNKSIEFRFGTSGGEARNNLVDAPLGSRSGATFVQSGNVTDATPDLFEDPDNANLHLKSSAESVIDVVDQLADALLDIDNDTRPSGSRADAGADEFTPIDPPDPDVKRSDLLGKSGSYLTLAQSNGVAFDSQIVAEISSDWNHVRVGDVNGDEVDDVVGHSNGTLRVAIAGNESFTVETWGGWSDQVSWVDTQLADVTGDGRADFLGRANGRWWIARSTGNEFVNERWATWSTAVPWLDVQVADVDGDEKQDVVGRRNGVWWVGISTGSAFQSERWGSWSSTANWENVKVADVNGDGRDDVVGMVSGRWWVARSTGDSFVNERWAAWSRTADWRDIVIGDFNNDGRDDIAGRNEDTWWVARSTGERFVSERWGRWSTQVSWQDVRVGDFDGDQRDDIAGRANGRWWVARSIDGQFLNERWGEWSSDGTWTDVLVGDFG